ncbi:hypothetical protein V6R21_11550 [Limibacter armeniacum]|uniref:hypothetical protein n=1 Tax=Limibacter armeniacum TaxID=466084 RepID=UPI002FE5E921
MKYFLALIPVLLFISCMNSSNNKDEQKIVKSVAEPVKSTNEKVEVNSLENEEISLESWADLIKNAPENSKSEFYLKDFKIGNLICLDSTKFGEEIRRIYLLESSYLLSVKPNIGKFYPCIIYGQQYDCDQITNFLALTMIDSTFKSLGQIEFISGFGNDWEGSWDYRGIIRDSTLLIKRIDDVECLDEEGNPIEGYSHLEIDEKYKLNIDGSIQNISNDTINKKYCRQQ